VLGLEFEPRSRTLISSGSDKQVLVWNWEDQSSTLLEQGCQRLEGYLRTNPQMQEEELRLCGQ
jgi:WD40 repeat protein